MAAAYVLSARQQLLFQVTQAYFGLQLAQENLAVVQQARHTAAAHLKIAQTRFQAGTVVHSDVLSAQVHLAKVTQEEMTAASQVQIARSALATVVGRPEAGERPLAPAPKAPAPLPPKLDDLKQTAQETRPDLQRLTLAARVAQQEYAKARLNYLPRLHVVAEYDVDQRRLFGSSADSYTVMALLNFNLFNGLTDLAKVRETRAKETQARDLKRDLEDRVRHQVTEAILNLKTAQARLGVAEKAVAQARESLRLIRLRYESGLTILVDLLNAEDATKNAELSRVAALFDTYLAQAGLDLALGTISGPVAEGPKMIRNHGSEKVLLMALGLALVWTGHAQGGEVRGRRAARARARGFFRRSTNISPSRANPFTPAWWRSFRHGYRIPGPRPSSPSTCWRPPRTATNITSPTSRPRTVWCPLSIRIRRGAASPINGWERSGRGCMW